MAKKTKIKLTSLKEKNIKELSKSKKVNSVSLKSKKNNIPALHQNREELLELFIEHSPAAVAMFDSEMKYIAVSQHYRKDYNLGDQEIIGKSHYDVFPEIPEKWKEVHKRCLAGATEKCDEDIFPRISGKIDWIRWEILPWYTSSGDIGGIILFSEVITENKLAQEKLIKSNRLYAVISQINQMIVRTKDRGKLYEEVCRIVIEYGKFKMVWIGEVNPLTKEVAPITFAGEENGYLKFINKISINNEPSGRGPTGKSIRENTHFISNDIENDLDFLPWKKEALKRGYKSSAAFPITSLGKVIGSLNIYSSEVNFFDKEEIQLLDEIVKDIDYALEAIENDNSRQLAEDKLYESEVRYRLLHESMMDSFIQVDMAGKIKDVNKSYLDMLGYNRDEVLRLTYHDITPSRWFEFEQKIVEQQILVKGYSDIYEKEYIKKDGTIFPVELRTYLLRDENGNPDGMWAIVRDITDRKQSNEKLKSSEQKFKTLFENANDAIFIMSEYKFIDCNSKTEEIFGCTREQILNHGPNDFSPRNQPDGRDSVEVSAEKITAAYAGEPQLFEWQHIKYDNTPFDAEVSLNKINIEGSVYLQAIVRDVTARKIAEAKLKESETKYRLLIDNQSDLVVQVNANGEFLFISPSYCKLFGKNEDELLGKNFMPLVYEDDRELTRISLESLKKPPHSSYHEQRAMTANGWRWLAWSNNAILDKDNSIASITAIGRDITEQKNAEAALIESEAKYRDMVEQINDIIFSTDINGNFTYISPTIEILGGYKPDEMMGHFMGEFIDPAFLSKIKEQFQKIISGNLSPTEYRVKTKTGGYKWVRSSSRPIFKENKPIGIRGVITDITERKKIEEALKKSEERLTAFMESATNGFILFDSDLNHLIMNSTALTITGLKKQDVLGKNILETVPGIIESGRYDKYKEVIKTGAPFHLEDITNHPLTGEKNIQLSAFRVGDGLGITFTDITERKRAEKDLVESEERFRAIFENSPVMIDAFDKDGKCILWNKSCETTYGYTFDEIRSHDDPLSLFYPDHNLRKQILEKVTNNPLGKFYESNPKTKNGNDLTTLWANFRLNDGSIINIGYDITEQKKAEQKIRENEEIFEQLLQNSPVYMFFKDENIRPIRLSKNYEKMLSMPLENILGKNMNELFPSELAKSMVEDDKKILQNGELVKVDEEFDGRYYTTIKFPINIEGKPTYLAGFTLDLTERVKAERELKQKMNELVRFNVLMVGRENKMIELKKEINELCSKLGLPKRYNPAD